ncbi:hypothetical protein FMUND_6512 [Fusarium mundagurra]|uniref:Uncharacterized protein n=1 Tax=Fusarium mundagurra TaxID=1567541 RepID=A0A8H5YPI2_9HYPO|nr:hypothetical protein FMUND_6512 [Fusarium mundagurra]
MQAEAGGAEEVMDNDTWNLAINYVDKKNDTSTSEAVCNGIWNEILRRNFPYPKFIIAPEQRQTSGKRPDLTVFFVDTVNSEWHPVFTFEGKAPHHIDKISKTEDGIAQAAGYVPSLSWSNHKEFHDKQKITYGMLACGKSFTILQYDVDKKEIKESKMLSLDTDAKYFDTFCKERANSF